jgi:hypothetical protein
MNHFFLSKEMEASPFSLHFLARCGVSVRQEKVSAKMPLLYRGQHTACSAWLHTRRSAVDIVANSMRGWAQPAASAAPGNRMPRPQRSAPVIILARGDGVTARAWLVYPCAARILSCALSWCGSDQIRSPVGLLA